MDRWKAEQGRGREKRKIRRKKSKKKEDEDAWKGRKVAKHYVFPMICGSGGSKSRLAKAAGAEPAGQMRHEKVHAVVARSTFPSQNGQNTRGADHFWQLRCRKTARRCGAKQISKWKCTKHTTFGPLLEVEMSKKCTPLWREAHFQVKMYNTHHVGPLLEVEMLKKCTPLWREADFQVKMYKAHHSRTTFGSFKVEFRKSPRRCGAKHISKWKCTKHTILGPLLEVETSSFEKVHAAVARSRFQSQNVQNAPCSDHFWRLRCRVAKKCTPLWREAQFQVNMLKNTRVSDYFRRFRCRFASLHFNSLHYTTWHDTTLRAVAMFFRAAGTCSADR